MRVWLACSALVALVALVNTLTYRSVTQVLKGSAPYALTRLEESYIPDKQCSGYIAHVKCPASMTVAVLVEAWDAVQFPDVRVNDSLASAAVYRRRAPSGECDGEANVLVSVACSAANVPVRVLRSAHRQPLQPAPPLT